MAERGAARPVAIALGVLALVVGAVAVALVWLAADARYEDGVVALARAPAGCEAVLDFDETGEFVVFVETSGRIDELRGDCDAAGSYELERVPDVTVVVTDPDGGAVELRPDADVGYDRSGFTGEAIGTIDVTTAGDHTVRVESDEADFAVAIGRDPGAGLVPLRVGAVAVGILAAAVGVALLVAGARPPRRRARRPGVEVGPPTAPESWYAPGPQLGRPPTSPPGGRSPGFPPSPPPPTSPPTSPPVRIPGEPLAPGPHVGRRPASVDDEPTGPRLAAPGPRDRRRSPQLPPPGSRGDGRTADGGAGEPDLGSWGPPDT